jgi:glucose-1-phosphatase
VSNSVDALLFDLGRVVIDLDSARVYARWSELSGVPAADLKQRSRLHVAGSEAFHRHERGEISDAAFFEHLRRTLEIDLTDEQLEDGWNAVFVGEMPGIRPVLARARQTLPLYAFSHFRKVYVSNELGARKPEAEAFQAVAAAMGVPAQRILFFDDLAANVAGAEACGMRAVQVGAVADIERALRSLGLDPSGERGDASPAAAADRSAGGPG